jgi:two-component system sensor histidine kinase HydH
VRAVPAWFEALHRKGRAGARGAAERDAGPAGRAAVAALHRDGAPAHRTRRARAAQVRARPFRDGTAFASLVILSPGGDDVTRHATQTPAPIRRFDLVGLAVGLALGGVDAGALLFFGADLTLGGRDVTALVLGGFLASFAFIGFAVGRLAMARERARRDADTIARQLRALEESQARALQNEKLAALGRMAAGVAHEVRNPLGVIRSSAQVAMEALERGSEEWRVTTFIVEEIDRLDGLVRGLLDFARPAPLRLQPLDVEKVVDRARQLAAPSLAERKIELEGGAPGGVAARCEADPDLVAQLLLDLLVNAAEAAGEGGRVALRTSAAPEGGVAFEVADSGPGVPDTDRDRVYEPFFTTKPRGTGLGLAMVERIVRSHGGAIAYAAGRGAGAGGAGACFRVTLPARPGAASLAAAPGTGRTA